MNFTARDLMVTDYDSIDPDAPVKSAVQKIFHGKVRGTGYKAFGIMVIDKIGELVGMISMYDLLYHLRPPFLNYELDTFNLWDGELEPYIESFSGMKVKEVMSSPVVTVRPDDHFMVIIDKMVKKYARRLPVVEGGRIVGIVYLSDVFHHLCGTWLDSE